jgi:hypothetical protein
MLAFLILAWAALKCLEGHGDLPDASTSGNNGTVLIAPYASQWLADMGAGVIKAEPPGGDKTRMTGSAIESGMAL